MKNQTTSLMNIRIELSFMYGNHSDFTCDLNYTQ